MKAKPKTPAEKSAKQTFVYVKNHPEKMEGRPWSGIAEGTVIDLRPIEYGHLLRLGVIEYAPKGKRATQTATETAKAPAPETATSKR